MRPVLAALLLGSLLFAPAASAAPGYCPRGPPGAVDCHDKLLSPGQDHLVVHVRPTVGEAHVAVYEPAQLEPGEAFVDAGYDRYGGGAVGEQVILVTLACPWDAPSEGCMPTEAFAGGHFAPQGHDARAWAGTDWTSAGASYATSVAGHDVAVQAGTFHFWMLQYLYVEAFVDGERYGFFEGVPAPLP